MKKYLLSIAVWFAFIIPAYSAGIGVTLTAATIDTALTDDIDSNGTINTRKNISNDINFGSLFIENTVDVGALSMTLGVDYVPFEAEFDSRSTSQSSIKDKDSSTTTGTNKGTADVKNHLTFYLQPTAELGDNGVSLFVTAGYVRADVESIVTSISSTNKTVEDTLDGTKLGIGLKKDFGGMFIKLEYAETDYDPISVTTSNNTKVTGDIDNKTTNLSIGRSF